MKNEKVFETKHKQSRMKMKKLFWEKLFLRGGSMLKISRKFSKKKCSPYLFFKRRKKNKTSANRLQ